MSGWRAIKTTGTNDTPLGNKRRFGAAPVEDQAPPQLVAPSPNDFPRARRQEPERSERKREYEESPSTPGTCVTYFSPFNPLCLHPRVSPSDINLADDQPRKRRSRWGEASSKAELPGLPTAISSQGISQAQLDNYAIQLRLEEINRKLRLNDYVPPERER